MFIILDPSAMYVFFFLAGYFAPPSLVKRGRYTFIKQKFLRILVPCILGTFLVALPTMYDMMRNIIKSLTIFDFTVKYFFGSKYSQLHYWFLSTLFILFLVYALVGKTAKNSDSKSESDAKSGLAGDKFAITAVIIFTALVCFVSINFFMGFEDWVNVFYITLLKPSRAGSYIASFILGIYAYNHKWFMQDYKRNTGLYFIASVISSAMTILIYLFGKTRLNLVIYNLVFSCLDSMFSIFVTMCMLDFFSGLKDEPPAIIKSVANFSYGIYWWHFVVMLFTVRLLYDHVSGAVSLAVITIILVFIISYVIHFITSKIFKKLGL